MNPILYLCIVFFSSFLAISHAKSIQHFEGVPDIKEGVISGLNGDIHFQRISVGVAPSSTFHKQPFTTVFGSDNFDDLDDLDDGASFTTVSNRPHFTNFVQIFPTGSGSSSTQTLTSLLTGATPFATPNPVSSTNLSPSPSPSPSPSGTASASPSPLPLVPPSVPTDVTQTEIQTYCSRTSTSPGCILYTQCSATTKTVDAEFCSLPVWGYSICQSDTTAFKQCTQTSNLCSSNAAFCYKLNSLLSSFNSNPSDKPTGTSAEASSASRLNPTSWLSFLCWVLASGLLASSYFVL